MARKFERTFADFVEWYGTDKKGCCVSQFFEAAEAQYAAPLTPDGFSILKVGQFHDIFVDATGDREEGVRLYWNIVAGGTDKIDLNPDELYITFGDVLDRALEYQLNT